MNLLPTGLSSGLPDADLLPPAWVDWLASIPPGLAHLVVRQVAPQPSTRIAARSNGLQQFARRLASVQDGPADARSIVQLGASIPDPTALRDAFSRREAASLFRHAVHAMGAGRDALAVAEGLPRALDLMEIAIFGLPELARIDELLGHPGDAPAAGTLFSLPPVLWQHPLWALAEAAGAQEGVLLHGAAAELLDPAWRALVDAGQGFGRVAWSLGGALGRC